MGNLRNLDVRMLYTNAEGNLPSKLTSEWSKHHGMARWGENPPESPSGTAAALATIAAPTGQT